MEAIIPFLALKLQALDLAIIGVFFIVVLGIGAYASKSAGQSTENFFLGGRGMPWWLLGTSMVACTFSCDTPNLVTDIVRTKGVAGNWVWWAFLLTGMLTVFIYAKLWRRSEVVTDLEFYELRYSGKAAAAVRGFRALYLGVFFNAMIMGTVTLAAVKIGQVLFNLSPMESILYASIAVVIYATLGGLTGCIWADFFQYSLAMVGAVWAAVEAVKHPAVGGLSGLFAKVPKESLSIIPPMDTPEQFWSVFVPVMLIPIAVQWWNVWYPGAEPGGGGYIAQRMLSAKNEKHAIGATLFFNFMHYAIRPWPWIIVALASLLVFPTMEDVRQQFPNISEQYLKDDICYPAMMTLLPTGVLGLVVAGLIAAYTSTIGTHLNWGSSYVVNDFYKRFVKPGASEKELVMVGRLSTVLLMLLAGGVALLLQSAKGAFDILLQVGAGTGLIYILRWFWWRINAWSEISAMIVSFLISLFFAFGLKHLVAADHWLMLSHWQLCVGISFTTLVWVIVTLVTRPVNEETLKRFVRKTRPGGPGWKHIEDAIVAEGGHRVQSRLGLKVLCIFLGTFGIWGSLFAIGALLFGNMGQAAAFGGVAAVSMFLIFRVWDKFSGEDS
ncbi:MAG: Na+:solute symporter [Akkermansiaceae bacterium]|jgi:Na+/proline symporter|nr:Na+:solute symporter [Akkermansiaceae bacterium]